MKQPKLTLQDFQQFNTDIINWNAIFGNIVQDEKIGTPADMARAQRFNSKLKHLYISLTVEEFTEYVSSIESKDLIETLDALCDMMFTGFFAGEATGYHTFVQETLDGGERQKLEDIVNNLKMVLTSTGETPSWKCRVTKQLVMQIVAHWQEVFNIRGAFNRVLKSNMTKATLITEGMDVSGVIASEKDYIEREGRYGDVWGDVVTHNGKGYIVMKAGKDLKAGVTFEGGKIIKPTTYKSPEGLGGLEEFIYEC